MNQFYKRILLDLLTAPSTVVPFTLGLSLILLSLVTGGVSFLGFTLCLVGFGMFVTNAAFNLNDVANRVLQEMQREKQAERGRRADRVEASLTGHGGARDTRALDLLRNLRVLYNDLQEDVRQGRINAIGSSAMLEQVDLVFDGCVSRLERQCQIAATCEKLKGDMKKQLNRQRDGILEEVGGTADNLAGVVSELRVLGVKASKGELTQLSGRLSQQLAAAKAAEAAMSEVDDYARFAEYQ